MTAGSALIATDAGGAPDIIENDINGLLVPMKDSRALARAMLRLSQEDQLSDRPCSAATRVVHDRYTIDKHVDKIFDIYQSLLEFH